MSLYNFEGVGKRTLPINYFHMAFTSSLQHIYNCITKKHEEKKKNKPPQFSFYFFFLHKLSVRERKRKAQEMKSSSTQFVLIYHGMIFFPLLLFHLLSIVVLFFDSETNTSLCRECDGGCSCCVRASEGFFLGLNKSMNYLTLLH